MSSPPSSPGRRAAARSGLARSAALLVASCAALLPACDSGGDPAAVGVEYVYPAGTVFGIDGHGVTAEEIERYIPVVALIEPQFVRRDHIRKVLSNISIPVAAGAALLPEDRDAAFQRAQELLAVARETGEVPPGAPAVMDLSGTWLEVGMASWCEAMNLEAGSFSELHETPGAWTFFQLVDASAAPGDFDPLTTITVRRYDVTYLPAEARRDLVKDAMDTLAIDVVDPEWEALIPPLYLYKNQGARSVPSANSGQ